MYVLIFEIFKSSTEMKLTEEHTQTVKQGQERPQGQEIEAIDQSVIGKGVIVEKIKGSKSGGPNIAISSNSNNVYP